MPNFYPLKIKNLIRETEKAVSIVFEVPEDIATNFEFICGQYLTLKTKLNGEEVRRAYSISSASDSVENNKEIQVTVKAITNGVFSNYANEKLNVGDYIEVASPEGLFKLETQKDNQKKYLAFVAGSGITPVFSMIQSVLEKEPLSTFTVVYGNKSPKETIFKTQLHTLKNKYLSRLNLNYIFSQSNTDDALFGRIDEGIVKYFINNKYNHVVFDDVFLCGPEQMIDNVKKTLLENNWESSHIHSELFVVTKSNENSNSDKSDNNHVKAVIVVDDESHEIEIKKDDNILSASLRNQIDAPYSCQGGVCSSCIAKVTKGKAYMRQNNILTDEEINEGLILTCQAYATSDEIEINFDDA